MARRGRRTTASRWPRRSQGDRADLPETLGVFYGELDNTEEYDFSVEWTFEVPAAATTTGVDFTLTGSADGHFPIPVGADHATTDAFCGDIDGEGITNSTFGAFKIEPGTPPAGAFTCADLPI